MLASAAVLQPKAASDPGLDHGPIIHMPARLVVIRHGESFANLIQRLIKAGKLDKFPEWYLKTPDREMPLSKRGCSQAKVTGPWLRQQYPDGFDVIYVSDHIRARQTVGNICIAAGWHDVDIRTDPLLGERNWGNFARADEESRKLIMESLKRDPLHTPMPDGEWLLQTRIRSRELLDRCVRECGNKRVLVVTHGEFIEALWSEIAHFNSDQQRAFFHSEEGNIRNCQVVEFSASDPVTEEYQGKLRWVRSSCPQAQVFADWKAIKRTTFKPHELIERTGTFPDLEGLEATAA